MNVTISNATAEEVTEFFMLSIDDLKSKGFYEVQVGGHLFMIREVETCSLGYLYKPNTRYTVHLEKVCVVPSPQQLAAEEAVKKAEESLKAAKESLEKIKESK